MNRFIPDGQGTPPDGWCHNPKGMPKPVNCSWCASALVDDEVLLLCPKCDRLDLRKSA